VIPTGLELLQQKREDAQFALLWNEIDALEEAKNEEYDSDASIDL
jgi:hypothetical protein